MRAGGGLLQRRRRRGREGGVKRREGGSRGRGQEEGGGGLKTWCGIVSHPYPDLNLTYEPLTCTSTCISHLYFDLVRGGEQREAVLKISMLALQLNQHGLHARVCECGGVSVGSVWDKCEH